MRVLVIGNRGQLGSEVVAVLERNHSLAILGIDYPEIDLADPDSVELVFGGFDPDFVINCAAYTAVDDAETDEDRALSVNGLGPRLIADECRKASAWLTHVSTDYVFDGTATTPYPEDADPSPATAYGRTKLAGDRAVQELLPDGHYLVRTAWLYGLNGTNFVKTMLRLEKERDTVSVVTDQIGQPTYAKDLAEHIGLLLDRHPAPGHLSRHQLGRGVLVRLRTRDLPAGGRGPGPGAAHDVRGVRSSGTASGVLRVGPRPVDGAGAAGDAAVAGGP